LPIAAIILNILAITHSHREAASKTVVITLKVRWINIPILGINAFILLAFALYLIGENIQDKVS
jgi:hypothetical protein